MVRLRLPPKKAFPHSISYKEPTGEENVWGNPAYTDSINLKHTRVDKAYDFRRNGVNSTDDMPNALIVLFKKYNKNMPEVKNQSLIEFNDKKFIVLHVAPLYFMSDEIIGYELEVK